MVGVPCGSSVEKSSAPPGASGTATHGAPSTVLSHSCQSRREKCGRGAICATGDGSTNYPWYIPDKKAEAWRPGEEADVTSVLDAFNQGFNFNKNLKKERGEEVKDGLDLSERIGTFVLLLVAAWSANVALTQSQDSRAESR